MEREDYKNLIIKQLLGDASAVETRKLDEWRTAAAENQKLYDDFIKIWQVAPKSEPEDIPRVDDEWLKTADSLGLQTNTPARVVELKKIVRPVRTPFLRNMRYWAIAAAIILIVTSSIMFNRLTKLKGTTSIIAKAGAVEQVELPDGSTVRLNSVSELSYETDFDTGSRVVHLAGEAFFKIEKDGRPFIVKTENAQVRVLGTVFDVWARENETRVIVQEGRVAVENLEGAQTERLLLTANQMGICLKNDLADGPIAVDASERLGWLQGRIVFSKTPLAEIIAELQRLYNVKIELENEDLKSQTLTASFDRKSIDNVLESICLALHLKFTKSGDAYRIMTSN